VTVRIEKDGRVVKDTTYRFENDTDAEQAVRMFEMLSGAHPGEMEYNYSMALSGEHEGKAMVFVSRDGEKTEVKEISGDSLVWVSEEEEEGPVKVMKVKVKTEDGSEGEHVVVVTSGEGGTFDVLIDEEVEGQPVKTEKRVKVIVTEDENGDTKVSKEEEIDSEEEVYVISGDELDKELKEIMEKVKSDKEEGENVQVIVIKKKDKSKQ
jgi:hypothetical protein